MLKILSNAIILLMLLVNLSCQQPDDTQKLKDIEIQIQTIPEYKEVKFSYQEEHYRIEWTTYELKHNQSVIKHHLQGDIALEEITPVMSAMLKAILDPNQTPWADKINTLSWGRIAPGDVSTKVELSKRLVVAAALSEQGDKKKGNVKKEKNQYEENDSIEMESYVRMLTSYLIEYTEDGETDRSYTYANKMASIKQIKDQPKLKKAA